MLYHYYAIALLCYCIILLLHYIVIMLYHYTLVLLECYRGVTVCVLLSIKLSLLCYCYYNFVITAKPQKLLVFRLTGTYYGSCCFITSHQWPDIVSMGVNSQNKGGGAAPVFFTLDPPPSKIISLQIWATSKLKFTFYQIIFYF